MKIGRNEPCPCGSGRKYKRCCAGGAAPVARSPELLRSVFQPGVDELIKARMSAILEVRSGLPLLLTWAIESMDLPPEFDESERLPYACSLMAISPEVWGPGPEAELHRRVPLSTLSSRAQRVARWLSRAEPGVWRVAQTPEGGLSVTPLVPAGGPSTRRVAAAFALEDRSKPPPSAVAIGWHISVDGLPIFLEHCRLERAALDDLSAAMTEDRILHDELLTTRAVALRLMVLAVASHIRNDPAVARAIDALAQYDEFILERHLQHDAERARILARGAAELAVPGPLCEAALLADSGDDLHELAREARWRGIPWVTSGERRPTLEPIFDRHLPSAALLEAVGLDASSLLEEDRALGSLPVALLVDERDIGEGVRARASIREALATTTGQAKDELEAAWRVFRAERRGIRLVTWCRDTFKGSIARPYELVRWLIDCVAPPGLAETPVRALAMGNGARSRLLAALRAEDAVPDEPSLKHLPPRWTALLRLRGVGSKTYGVLLQALLTHLTDWRSQRARLPPAELRREEPRDAAAAAALEAGLDDLEALFA